MLNDYYENYYERLIYYFQYKNNKEIPYAFLYGAICIDPQGTLCCAERADSVIEFENFIEKTDEYKNDEGFRLWLKFKLMEAI